MDTIELSTSLLAEDVPTREALQWPIVDVNGNLLCASGSIIDSVADRDFLFKHFQPQRGDLYHAEQAAQQVINEEAAAAAAQLNTIKDLGLMIGTRLKLRAPADPALTVHSCRVIGFAPNHSLFVTPPFSNGRRVVLVQGEKLELVAMLSASVYRFMCTVESICKIPFPYLVLSSPSSIQKLRARKSVRIRTKFVARYAMAIIKRGYEGMGIVNDISPRGMSLAAPKQIGQIGHRLRVAFQVRTNDVDVDIETYAVVRNVQGPRPGQELTMHGLEFEKLEPFQVITLKCFVLDQGVISG